MGFDGHKLVGVPDEHDFETVLRTYQDRVFRLCCAITGNRALAEETAQEVFVRVWKSLPGFRGESSLSTWIYMITRNACLTAVKNNRRHPQLSLDVAEIRRSVERITAGSSTPDRAPDVLHLVNQLPDRYRQVILLYHMQEKSYDEVAVMLDLPLGTVKTYLHRARKQLAAAMSLKEETAISEDGS